MRLFVLSLLCGMQLTLMAQFQHNRVDPLVNLQFVLQPFQLRGLTTAKTPSGASSSAIFHTSVEEKAMVFGLLVQGGADVNILMKEKSRTGVRLGAGAGQQTGGDKAQGMDGFVWEYFGYGFYRKAVGGIELAGLLGYEHYSGILPFHFLMAGAEIGLNKNFGIQLSASLNKYIYYRLFSNGEEEPGLSVREFALTITYRY